MKMRTAIVIAALLLAGDAAAAADPAVKCAQAVLKGAAKLAHARVGALAKCENAKRAGKLPPLPPCAEEPAVVAARGAAEAKLATAVERGCGGDDRRCGGADDVSLAALGWPAGCPDLEGPGCARPIASCADVPACLDCLAGVAVERGLGLAAAPFAVADPARAKAIGRCQKAIAAAAATLADKHAALDARCLAQRLAGKHQAACPLPGDGKSAASLAALRAGVAAKVCTACGGADRRCGGGDDLPRESIGIADHCPSIALCGGPIGGVADLVACLDCTAATRTQCALAAAAPSVAPYPAACAVVPPTPTATPVASATPTVTPTPTLTTTPQPTPSPVFCPAVGAGTVTTAVTLMLTGSAPIGGASLVLDYPPHQVRLPGVDDDAAVKARVADLTGQPPKLLAKGAPNNQDGNADREPDRVLFTLVSTDGVSGAILRVTFDRCASAALTTPADFACTIVGTPVQKDGVTPVTGAACAVGVVHAP